MELVKGGRDFSLDVVNGEVKCLKLIEVKEDGKCVLEETILPLDIVEGFMQVRERITDDGQLDGYVRFGNWYFKVE